jgi:hypothetical protein
MTQNQIELILVRQLASHIAIPMFVVDAEGGLLFYNESAGALLGHLYTEAGDLPLEEWTSIFQPSRENGSVVPREELPLVVALRERRPAFLSPLYIAGLDKVRRRVAVAAFPIEGQQGGLLGAVAVFAEVKD